VNDCQWQSEPRQAFPQKSESLSLRQKIKDVHRVDVLYFCVKKGGFEVSLTPLRSLCYYNYGSILSKGREL